MTYQGDCFIYETPKTETQLVDGIGPWHARRQWCQEYCHGQWEYAGFGIFNFWDQNDYLWFVLRWS